MPLNRCDPISGDAIADADRFNDQPRLSQARQMRPNRMGEPAGCRSDLVNRCAITTPEQIAKVRPSLSTLGIRSVVTVYNAKRTTIDTLLTTVMTY